MAGCNGFCVPCIFIVIRPERSRTGENLRLLFFLSFPKGICGCFPAAIIPVIATPNYIGRLAPSPTGLLHLGHAATFITAHERARKARGRLLLRIDDLDTQRSKEHFIAAAKEDLHWLGITWDAEVRQSERLSLYKRAVQQLIYSGHAYPCLCSRKDLQGATQAPHEDTDDEPIYNGRCRPSAAPKPVAPSSPTVSSSVRVGSGASQNDGFQPHANYRFRVPDGETIRFTDEHLGPQQFTVGCYGSSDFGDFVVWRKDGLPSYQLACAVDDAAMGITEVVRGRDLLKSTARQILLGRVLGLRTPQYFHTELLCDAGGERLAKRHDALSLQALRASGMTPQELRARL